MKNVTVYMGPMCCYCDAAKRLLTKKNIPYKEINVALEEDKINEMIKKSYFVYNFKIVKNPIWTFQLFPMFF